MNQLEFGNKKQQLICRRLNDDYKKYANIKYLEKSGIHPDTATLVAEYKDLNKKKQTEKDPYYNSLIVQNMNDIIDKLVKPIIDYYREHYNKSFDSIVNIKRIEEKEKIFKYLKKIGVEKKITDIVLDY